MVFSKDITKVISEFSTSCWPLPNAGYDNDTDKTCLRATRAGRDLEDLPFPAWILNVHFPVSQFEGCLGSTPLEDYLERLSHSGHF